MLFLSPASINVQINVCSTIYQNDNTETDNSTHLYDFVDLVKLLFIYLLLKTLPSSFLFVSEFSESLREMGVCLLQKIALNDDEESGELPNSDPGVHLFCIF